MEFVVYRRRREGVLVPRHVMWASKTQGELYVVEQHDKELNRAVRVATIRDRGDRVIAGPLFDVTIISAKPDWWTVTGWERTAAGPLARECAFQQSWILVPADRAT